MTALRDRGERLGEAGVGREALRASEDDWIGRRLARKGRGKGSLLEGDFFLALPGWAGLWFRPGTFLTDWTGDIPDTVTELGRVERLDALESEQCDGRASAVCV
jgi:hypothetical protein